MERFTYREFTEYNGDKVITVCDHSTGLLYHIVDDGNVYCKGRIYRCGQEDYFAPVNTAYLLLVDEYKDTLDVMSPNFIEKLIEMVETEIRNSRN